MNGDQLNQQQMIPPEVVAQQQEQQMLEELTVRLIDKLNAMHEKINIAEDLDESLKIKIASKVLEDFDIDDRSRAEWMTKMEKAVKLSKMLTKERYYGGAEVASSGFPLIASAAVSFNSRAYPEIIKGKDVVKCEVQGNDPDGFKKKRGLRVADHMSFQIKNQMGRWEDDEDALLMVLPIMGCGFKKTYYDGLNKRNASEIVYPEDLVVNYKAKSIENATRISHVIELTTNEIIERMNAGIFLPIPVDQLKNPVPKDSGKPQGSKHEPNDEDAPHTFIEQHCWYDLDEDGYKEPYVITVHKNLRKLVRIAARWDMDDVFSDGDGNIVKINPVHYFTRFLFIPSADGGFYGMGFGTLLTQMNETVNTTINQMLDAGTLQNRPIGFISRGLQIGRTEGGNLSRFQPGEFKTVSAVGDDLRKAIVPMPTGQVSPMHFKLMDYLITSGKELAMQSDVLSGHSPGSNVPAATVVSLIEQGLKVYTGVFKRIHRAHKDEYSKIRRLNKLYLSQEEYQMVLDDPEADVKADYASEDFDIIPISDPQNSTDIQRLMKAQTLLQLVGKGLNDNEIYKRYIDALQIENAEAIINKPDETAAQMQQMQMEQLAKQLENMEAQTALIYEKANTEQVKQAAEAAKIEIQKAQLMLDAAMADDEAIRKRHEIQNKGKDVTGKDGVKKKKEAPIIPPAGMSTEPTPINATVPPGGPPNPTFTF